MEEPSMPKPSSNEASPNSPMGYETWCHKPGRSVNRRSSSLMPLSFTNFNTSFGSAMECSFFIAEEMKVGLHAPVDWATRIPYSTINQPVRVVEIHTFYRA